MANKDLWPILKKTKRLVLSGLRGKRLANELEVSERTAHGYIQRLVLMGELVDITGDPTSTPRIYDDAKKRVQFCTPSSPSEFGNQKRVGVESTKDPATCPPEDKSLRFHCTGAYICLIQTLGAHTGRISDSRGLTVGNWSKPANCNGSVRQYGSLRLPEGDDLKFTLYLAKAGPKLTVTPQPRDVFYKTANNEGPRALWGQVYSLLNLLTEVHGWQFGQILYKGTNHGAVLSGVIDPLIDYMDLGNDSANARYHVDTSTGSPELEVYYNRPEAQKDVDLIFELPQRFESIQASLTGIYGVLNTVSLSLEQLANITAQLATTQANITKTISKPINEAYQTPPFDGRGYN